ncbi:Transposon Tf2-8 polyprotein [Araneus ventricosus]|uniref:RNA-directed DNA polymerase n=1 Tax=Araneus ventricosus TaxID=182803 RepID=A0A4Y2QFI7_ARAVE|nr:Transposon Tf2-8 polyprotein [Araneus ventricosus]
MVPPKNVKQVQSFLQTCSWYRNFISNFAEKSRPLNNLAKKNAPWKWEEEEQKAFNTLIQCLTTAPILKQVDDTKPFIIRTHASNYAIGAVLLQGSGAEEYPIEYASRLLNSAERKYSTTEREALAVVWALIKFRGYVEGSKITVASDHQPLKWLMGLKSSSGRLARWALQFQSFNLKIEYIPGKANVLAGMLSRPICTHKKPNCEICTITIPARSSKDIRNEQMKDDGLKKIIDTFESPDKGTDYFNWTERGCLMNRGVLYRYSPDSESDEAQLVVPTQEREQILRDHHDAPTAGHYGTEGTFNRISNIYYWTGMRKFITDYVKNCPECNRFKDSNQNPAGLLQTPVSSQRFETLAIDLFGLLPESKDGKKWIFIVEDYTTKWVELFALPSATAKEFATTLLEEVLLRYGIPRRIISDNGTQFVSAVMQQLCYLLNIKQSLIPVYHTQANPVERKNRDLKPRLAILVYDKQNSWSEKLPLIRFALNTAKCQTTGQTASFLHFGRELRRVDDVMHDLRAVIENDNFVAEITPYVKKFSQFMAQAKEVVEQQQDKRKQYADKRRHDTPQFHPGDKIYVTSHPVSSADKGKTSKFLPRRDGPYLILSKRSPTTYEIANFENPRAHIGVYHTSALRDNN